MHYLNVATTLKASIGGSRLSISDLAVCDPVYPLFHNHFMYTTEVSL